MTENEFPDSYEDIQGQDEDMKTVMEIMFPGRRALLEAGMCTNCQQPVNKDKTTFRDEISWREYLISGLCQLCQDKFDAIFKEMENSD